jgi:Uma2 family endonuclease
VGRECSIHGLPLSWNYGEGIQMTPPPVGSHNLIADWVNRALLQAVPDGSELFQTQDVGIERTGGIDVPDFYVAPRGAVPHNSDPVPAEHVPLAVEITARGDVRHDRSNKKWAYAHGPIPLYLLIDQFDENGPAVSLFSKPVEGVYGKTIRDPGAVRAADRDRGALPNPAGHVPVLS